MDELILPGIDDGWEEEEDETFSLLDTPPIDGMLENTSTSSPQAPPTEEFRKYLVRMGLIPNEEAFLEMWGRFHQLDSMHRRTPHEEAELDNLKDRLTQLENEWQMERERERETETVNSILDIMANLPNGTSIPLPPLSPPPPTPSPTPSSTPRVQTTTTAATPRPRAVIGQKAPRTRPLPRYSSSSPSSPQMSPTQQSRHMETTIQRLERELWVDANFSKAFEDYPAYTKENLRTLKIANRTKIIEYHLASVVNLERNVDKKRGNRFLLELVLLEHTVQGKMAHTPIVFRLSRCGRAESDQTRTIGFWEIDGFGIFSTYKSDWKNSGGVNVEEFQNKWGGEDWEMIDRVLTKGLEVEILRLPYFYHFYHERNAMWEQA
ncbi:hypothetical protein QZH41_006691 [Actinostola sp. cb2023]|nr:hypothetical protein QZH41_006691 [Actinostola sp. cb2023]